MHMQGALLRHDKLVTLPCRDDIRQDPTFRAQFHVMCANVGVDPLASNKGMFAQLLGIGDFYYQLGVQIIEACLATRTHNGGMIELSLLTRLVQVRLGSMAQLTDGICCLPPRSLCIEG